MSWVKCEACDALFDSDEDPDCFVEVGNMRRLHQTLILCEHCRDDREQIEEERAHACDTAMFWADMEEQYERTSKD